MKGSAAQVTEQRFRRAAGSMHVQTLEEGRCYCVGIRTVHRFALMTISGWLLGDCEFAESRESIEQGDHVGIGDGDVVDGEFCQVTTGT